MEASVIPAWMFCSVLMILMAAHCVIRISRSTDPTYRIEQANLAILHALIGTVMFAITYVLYLFGL